MSEKIVQIYKYIIKRKYPVIILIFLLWMVFLDEDNVFVLMKKNKELDEIYLKKNELVSQINQDSIQLNEIETNEQALENYAREHFFYHKPDEQIYKIIYKTSDK